MLVALVVLGAVAAIAGVRTLANVIGTDDDTDLASYASGTDGVVVRPDGAEFAVTFPRAPRVDAAAAADPAVDRLTVTVEGTELSVTWFVLSGGVPPEDPAAVLGFLSTASASRLGAAPEAVRDVTGLGVPGQDHEVRLRDPDPEVHQVRTVLVGARVIELRVRGSIARTAVFERFASSLQLDAVS